MDTAKTVKLKRAVITGLGAVTPVGDNAQETWSSLIAGTSGAGPITRFDAAGFRTRFAGEVKGFEPLDHFEAKEIKKLDMVALTPPLPLSVTSAKSGRSKGCLALTMAISRSAPLNRRLVIFWVLPVPWRRSAVLSLSRNRSYRQPSIQLR